MLAYSESPTVQMALGQPVTKSRDISSPECWIFCASAICPHVTGKCLVPISAIWICGIKALIFIWKACQSNGYMNLRLGFLINFTGDILFLNPRAFAAHRFLPIHQHRKLNCLLSHDLYNGNGAEDMDKSSLRNLSMQP